MNVYNLDTLSLQYIRRPVDDDARTELSAFFTVAYNEIYRRIMSEAYRITFTENVQLDNNKSFSCNSLSKRLITIKNIRTPQNEKLLWERGTENNINVHTAASTVIVTYCYMPGLLQNSTPTTPPESAAPSNTPVIPEEYHNIFSLWAAYRYLHSRRKFEDSNYYYEMAMELFMKLSNDFGEKTRLKVNYMN